MLPPSPVFSKVYSQISVSLCNATSWPWTWNYEHSIACLTELLNFASGMEALQSYSHAWSANSHSGPKDNLTTDISSSRSGRKYWLRPWQPLLNEKSRNTPLQAKHVLGATFTSAVNLPLICSWLTFDFSRSPRPQENSHGQWDS